jgi:hypothetical protein
MFPFSAVSVMRVGVGLSNLPRVFRDIVGRGFMIAGHIRSVGNRDGRDCPDCLSIRDQ